jgi:hypothetical protein
VIEVLVTPTGDRAEAPDPESAIAAARQLLHDARDHGCGTPAASFYVEGRLVRSDVTVRSLA